jgi:hypothetical protein
LSGGPKIAVLQDEYGVATLRFPTAEIMGGPDKPGHDVL